MRVITGKYKGRTLVAPKQDARPTLDRTKETLFNILAPLLEGSSVLDLFAGSGQLAIECLSRGARQAVLCDSGKSAAQAIRENFQKIGEEPILYNCDFRRCLSSVSQRFDVVFVDPPYAKNMYAEVLRLLIQYDCVAEGGIVVCEHSRGDEMPCAKGLEIFDVRNVGSVAFTFYKRSSI